MLSTKQLEQITISIVKENKNTYLQSCVHRIHEKKLQDTREVDDNDYAGGGAGIEFGRQGERREEDFLCFISKLCMCYLFKMLN